MRISDWSSDVCSSDLSRYSGRHVSDDLNYGAFAPIPRSRLVDQNAQHVEKAHHGPEHIDTAPRTVDNDGRSEERRVGKECVRTCRSRCALDNYKKQEHKDST